MIQYACTGSGMKARVRRSQREEAILSKRRRCMVTWRRERWRGVLQEKGSVEDQRLLSPDKKGVKRRQIVRLMNRSLNFQRPFLFVPLTSLSEDGALGHEFDIGFFSFRQYHCVHFSLSLLSWIVRLHIVLHPHFGVLVGFELTNVPWSINSDTHDVIQSTRR